MKLTTDGDTELWVMKTPDWDAPIYCNPVIAADGRQFWIITIAEWMGHRIPHEIGAMLRAKSAIQEPTRWIVPRGTLKDFAEKAGGITPKFYVRMSEGRAKLPEEFTVDEIGNGPENDEDFIRTAYARSQIANLGTFKAVWRSIIDTMGHHLLIENKPVDIGWFVIHAMPFRVNWKGYLTGRHPRLNCIYQMNRANKAAALVSTGVEEDLLNTELMAVKGDGKGRTLFRWSVELEEKPEWVDYQEQVEYERCVSGKPWNYLNRWATIVNRMRGTIHERLHQYCRQVALACGRMAKDPGRGQYRLVSYIPEGKSRGSVVGRVEGPLVGDDGTPSVRSPDGQKAKVRAAAPMPDLPILRPSYPNLRPPRGNVARAGGSGEAGVLVPPAAGGDGPGEEVLG